MISAAFLWIVQRDGCRIVLPFLKGQLPHFRSQFFLQGYYGWVSNASFLWPFSKDGYRIVLLFLKGPPAIFQFFSFS